MLYLLDANTLINAKRDYFQLKRVPEYWDWLSYMGSVNKIKIPYEIYGEFFDTKNKDGTRDELAEWSSDKHVKNNLQLVETVNIDLVNQAMDCYGKNLNEAELREMGRDPFLIAYALASPETRVIITAEVSAPKKQRQNRRVPDVCSDLQVKCKTSFDILNELDFSTNWRSKL